MAAFLGAKNCGMLVGDASPHSLDRPPVMTKQD